MTAPSRKPSWQCYTQLKLLGSGACGQVYLVEGIPDKGGPRGVHVVKRVFLDGMDERARQQALNEVDVLSLLNHPNVIRVVDHFVDDESTLNIVMEHAERGDLSHLIEDRAPNNYLTDEQVMGLSLQILRGLQYVHERKVVHCDLKPANILITKDHTLKIADFGIARAMADTASATKSHNSLAGTPFYLAPELCDNKPFTAACDVWSLGCVIYELAALTRAFSGNNVMGIISNINKGIYQPLPSSFSQQLHSLVKRTLVVDAKKRSSIPDLLKVFWPNGEKYVKNLSLKVPPVDTGRPILTSANTPSRKQSVQQPLVLYETPSIIATSPSSSSVDVQPPQTEPASSSVQTSMANATTSMSGFPKKTHATSGARGGRGRGVAARGIKRGTVKKVQKLIKKNQTRQQPQSAAPVTTTTGVGDSDVRGTEDEEEGGGDEQLDEEPPESNDDELNNEDHADGVVLEDEPQGEACEAGEEDVYEVLPEQPLEPTESAVEQVVVSGSAKDIVLDIPKVSQQEGEQKLGATAGNLGHQAMACATNLICFINGLRRAEEQFDLLSATQDEREERYTSLTSMLRGVPPDILDVTGEILNHLRELHSKWDIILSLLPPPPLHSTSVGNSTESGVFATYLPPSGHSVETAEKMLQDVDNSLSKCEYCINRIIQVDPSVFPSDKGCRLQLQEELESTGTQLIDHLVDKAARGQALGGVAIALANNDTPGLQVAVGILEDTENALKWKSGFPKHVVQLGHQKVPALKVLRDINHNLCKVVNHCNKNKAALQAVLEAATIMLKSSSALFDECGLSHQLFEQKTQQCLTPVVKAIAEIDHPTTTLNRNYNASISNKKPHGTLSAQQQHRPKTTGQTFSASGSANSSSSSKLSVHDDRDTRPQSCPGVTNNSTNKSSSSPPPIHRDHVPNILTLHAETSTPVNKDSANGVLDDLEVAMQLQQISKLQAALQNANVWLLSAKLAAATDVLEDDEGCQFLPHKTSLLWKEVPHSRAYTKACGMLARLLRSAQEESSTLKQECHDNSTSPQRGNSSVKSFSVTQRDIEHLLQNKDEMPFSALKSKLQGVLQASDDRKTSIPPVGPPPSKPTPPRTSPQPQTPTTADPQTPRTGANNSTVGDALRIKIHIMGTDKTRLVAIPKDCTLSVLKNVMSECGLSKTAPGKIQRIQYKDAEGDFIIVEHDNDWQEMWKDYQSQRQKFKDTSTTAHSKLSLYLSEVIPSEYPSYSTTADTAAPPMLARSTPSPPTRNNLISQAVGGSGAQHPFGSPVTAPSSGWTAFGSADDVELHTVKPNNTFKAEKPDQTPTRQPMGSHLLGGGWGKGSDDLELHTVRANQSVKPERTEMRMPESQAMEIAHTLEGLYSDAMFGGDLINPPSYPTSSQPTSKRMGPPTPSAVAARAIAQSGHGPTRSNSDVTKGLNLNRKTAGVPRANSMGRGRLPSLGGGGSKAGPKIPQFGAGK